MAYIGISQGNTTLFGLFASKPEYNKKISLFIAIAPVVNTKHSFEFVPKAIRHPAMALHRKLLLWMACSPAIPIALEAVPQYLCSSHPFTFISDWLMPFTSWAAGGELINYKRSQVFLSRGGGRFSSRCLAQSLQWHVSAEFRYFDFGPEENRTIYGEETPPRYDLDNITNKSIAFITAKNDSIVDIRDVNILRETLKGGCFQSLIGKSFFIC